MYFFFLFYLLYLYKKLLYDLYYKLNNIYIKLIAYITILI